MRKSSIYGLNLWDLDDRIKMEDFNANTEKLETTIKNLFNNSGLDFFIGRGADEPTCFCGSLFFSRPEYWKKYNVVFLFGSITDAGNGGSPSVSLVTPEAMVIPNATFEFVSGAFCFIFLPFKYPAGDAKGYFLSQDKFQPFHLDVPFEEITSINMASGPYASSTPKMWIPSPHTIAFR